MHICPLVHFSNGAEDEETAWLKHMERQFQQIAGEDGQIDLAEFKRALKVKDVSIFKSLAVCNNINVILSVSGILSDCGAGNFWKYNLTILQ